MEYYSAIKKNEIISFAKKWIEPEINILSEKSQILHVHMLSLICGTRA
jgi:hypothetical protein